MPLIQPISVRCMAAARSFLRSAGGTMRSGNIASRLSVIRSTPMGSLTLEMAYYGAGRYAESEAMFRKLLELAPGFTARARQPWQDVAGGRANRRQRSQWYNRKMARRFRLYLLPIVLQANGRKAEADEALQALIARCADRCAYGIALNYAYRGDHDLALHWLERAYEQKDGTPSPISSASTCSRTLQMTPATRPSCAR